MTVRKISFYVKDNYPGHVQAYASEFFNLLVREGKTEERKVELFREYMRENVNKITKVRALRTILNCIYLPEWKFELPLGMPAHSELIKSIDAAPGNVYKATRSIHYFLPTNPGFMKEPKRRIKMYEGLFDSMYVGDAAVFLAMKDGNPWIIQLDFKTLCEAVPGWFNESMKVNKPFMYDEKGEPIAVTAEPGVPRVEEPAQVVAKAPVKKTVKKAAKKVVKKPVKKTADVITKAQPAVAAQTAPTTTSETLNA